MASKSHAPKLERGGGWFSYIASEPVRLRAMERHKNMGEIFFLTSLGGLGPNFLNVIMAYPKGISIPSFIGLPAMERPKKQRDMSEEAAAGHMLEPQNTISEPRHSKTNRNFSIQFSKNSFNRCPRTYIKAFQNVSP